MRLFRNILQKISIKVGILASLVLLVLGLGLNLAEVYAQNIAIPTGVNCDANAVVYCGATSLNSLVNKYNNGDGVNSAASIHNIYSYFGITSASINAMASGSETVEAGSVTKSGDVYDAGNKLVATGATTAGRQDISGSTVKTVNGTTFYVRPPSVSFLSSSLSAYVVLNNGKFVFAILASCGNPVIATAVASPPAKTTSPPAKTTTNTTTNTTTTTNTSICSGNTTNVNNGGIASQGGNCSTNTTVIQTSSPAPFGQCSSLSVSVVQNNPLEISATANPSVGNGAQLSSVTFNFGDGTTTSPSSQTTQTHTYASNQNYTITATMNFSGGTASIPNSVCTAALTTTSPTPTTPTTPSTPVTTTTSSVTTTATPTSLVNTGPGDAITLFGATSLIGFLGYRVFLAKRLAS